MNKKYMQRAIELAKHGMEKNKGGPFGCVVVYKDAVVGEGSNCVTSSNDPTAHAEVVAIRNACQELGTFQLTGCDIYASCEPCPMCLGAIYWARPDHIYYAANRNDAADAGFDDSFVYEELSLPQDERSIPMQSISRQEALEVFKEWKEKENKIEY